MNLKDKIENYIPFDEQEERDKEQFLKFIDTFDDVLTRDNIFGHFTASAFVVNKERTKMVVVYHIINEGWIYPGGHVDGEEDFLSVAVREVKEETGLKVDVLDQNIFSIQSAAGKGHIKRGKYVSESKGVKWIPFEEATNETMCDFIRPIHKKLIKKLNIKQNY